MPTLRVVLVLVTSNGTLMNCKYYGDDWLFWEWQQVLPKDLLRGNVGRRCKIGECGAWQVEIAGTVGLNSMQDRGLPKFMPPNLMAYGN